jgi:hypothetical protein
VKRGGPLARRTRLAGGKPLRRRGPLERSKPRPLRFGRSRIPLLREAVHARAGGRCDIGGGPLQLSRCEAHHRKLRSQGGPDELANLLVTCTACHARAHANPAWARERGYIVASHDDPATRPVLRHGRRWQLPTTHGWAPVEAPRDEREAA